VRDLASSNGTLVNGVEISDQPLTDGDSITVGNSVLLYARGELADGARGTMVDDVAHALTKSIDIEGGAYPSASAQQKPLDRTTALAYEALIRISSAINALRDERELHRELLQLLDAVPADEAAIVTGDPNKPSIAASRAVGGSNHVRVSRTAFARALTDRAGILCGDAAVDQSFRSVISIREASIRSLICVPIAGRGHVFGAVYLASKLPDMCSTRTTCGSLSRRRELPQPRSRTRVTWRDWSERQIYYTPNSTSRIRSSARAASCSRYTTPYSGWRERTRQCSLQGKRAPERN